MIELYSKEQFKIFYKNPSKMVLTTTGIFKSSDYVWTGSVVYALLVQHDKENHLLPPDQWYWTVRYPIIYEYCDITPIAVWVAETPFKGYIRYDWEEYQNGMK